MPPVKGIKSGMAPLSTTHECSRPYSANLHAQLMISVGYNESITKGALTMSQIGCGYGSEWHLLRYLGYHRALFSQRIGAALGASQIEWLDFPFSSVGGPLRDDREFKGLAFLESEDILAKWSQFWPQSGNAQNWDAVGRATIGGEKAWVLVEAKAHAEEIESRCGAKSQRSKAKIEKALRAVRAHVGATAQPLEHWFEPYYQYANRLAVLCFLEREGVNAHLVNVYFYGERKSGWQCPQSAAGWEDVVRVEEAWLGIARDSAMMKRVHHVFLAVNPLTV